MSRLLECTSETRPLEPLIGDTWLETDTGSIIVYGPIGWSVYSLGFITFPEELENNESNIQVYEVNINSNEGSVIGGGQYAAGNVVTLSATPNSGYLFDGWTVVSGGVTIINNSFTMPEGSVSITANYSIDASGPLGDSDGDGVLNQDDLYPNDSQRASGNDKDNDGIDDEFDTSYAVSITSSNGSVTGAGQKTVGSTVTLSATPNTGYTFSGWTVNSGGVTISNNSFTMPAEDVSITANYTAIDYTVTVGGSNGTESGGGTYNFGETVTLSATPNTGYTFSGWTVNSGGVTISNNSFTMPAGNVSITANYTAIDYTVTVGGSNGTESGGGTYNFGETVTLSATPNTGYTFSGWTVNSGGVTISNNSFTMPAGNVSITANYVIDSSGPLGDSDGDGVLNQDDLYPNDSQRASGNDKDNDGIDDEFDTSYAVSITSSNGSVTGSGQKEVGSTINLSSVPDSGYTFDGWIVNSGGVTISNNSFVMPDNDVSITANYVVANYTVTVDGVNGTETGAGAYNVGDTVTISASPDSGYTFDGWTVDNNNVYLGDPQTTLFDFSTNNNLAEAAGSINTLLIEDGVNEYSKACRVDSTRYLECNTISLEDFCDQNDDFTFSISAWVNLSQNDKQRVVALGDRNILFGTSSSGGINLIIYSGGSSTSYIQKFSNNSLQLGTAGWTHMAATYDGSKTWQGIKLYVNGQLINQSGQGAGTYQGLYQASPFNNNLRIGSWALNNSNASGLIDDVAIFNYELTDLNVSQLYDRQTSINTPVSPPFAWWKMGDGQKILTMPQENVSITANYVVANYTVTVDGVNGTETGAGAYNVGDTVTISASPDSGYTFDGWTVNSGGVTISNNSFVMPDNDVSITADYVVANYTVTMDGVNGTETGAGTYNVGDTVTISASPDSGYTFEGWTVNQGQITMQSLSDWTQIGGDIHGEAAGDLSGNVALSSDGTIVAIGATKNDGGGGDTGHVRIYQNTNDAWTQIGGDIDGEAAGDRSGESIALSSDGTIVAIGAYGNDAHGGDTGHVRIYQNTNDAWTQIGGDIDGEAAGDFSGWSVALSSDGLTVAIGAPTNSGGGTWAGRVGIYRNTNGAWTQIGGYIYGEAYYDQSGSSVALSSDGTIVAIGAYANRDGGRVRLGRAGIYRNTNGAWTQIGGYIYGEAAYDVGGYSVALSSDGTIVAIAAPGNDGGGDAAGRVGIYRNTNDAWTQIGGDIYGEAADDSSGDSVALSSDGTIVAIGAKRNSDGGTWAGHVRIYQNTNDAWTQIGGDIDGEAAGDDSGYSVALSSDGSTVAIGAIEASNQQNGDGYVRIFNINHADNSFVMPAENVSITANYSIDVDGPLGDSDGDGTDPLISSSSGVELYVGAKFLDDGNVPWIVTNKINDDKYILKSQGRAFTIYSGFADPYEWTIEFTGVNCSILKPHPLSLNQYTTTGNWWVHDGETDNHPNRTSNHDGLPDLRLQLKNRSDGRRGGYLRYVSPNDEALNALYDANIVNPVD
jgi:uncharacterized repeat protein (TIGR02543 family)